jgi:hypothetical protein
VPAAAAERAGVLRVTGQRGIGRSDAVLPKRSARIRSGAPCRDKRGMPSPRRPSGLGSCWADLRMADDGGVGAW